MAKAIRIHRNGGPEEMVWEDAPVAPLASGEVRVRHTAIGINFSDINVRRGGFYPNQSPDFPLILGNEAAGVVEEVGPAVTEFTTGDRVAYAGIHGQFYEDTGAYCEVRNVPEDRLVPIPDNVSDEQAAALLLKGSTVSLMINRLFTPGPEDIVLIHAAASGVGSLLCQWSSHLGAKVIGTVGSRDKVEAAKSNGCDQVILYRETDFVAETLKIASQGVSAFFDGVGADTFISSLDCLRPFGKAINYGNASGSVPPLNIQSLAIKSLSVSRAGVTGHIQDAASLRSVAAELFELAGRGILRAAVQKSYALRDAAMAHKDIEAARSSGSLLLVP